LQSRRIEAGRVDVYVFRRKIVRQARGPRLEASERQNPSASSSSWPGVRIVTATGSPPIGFRALLDATRVAARLVPSGRSHDVDRRCGVRRSSMREAYVSGSPESWSVGDAVGKHP